MKTLATMTAIAALVAGMSVASAQNPAQPQTGSTSPSNLNAGGTSDTKQTGAQTQSGAQTPGVKGSVTTTQSATNPAASPSDPNYRSTDGDAKLSGAQSKDSQMKSSGKATAPAATTGDSSKSPADPNAKPPTSSK